MNILVTAGSTRTPIDKVRVITNIFKGKTGVSIADYLSTVNNHNVDLLTSNNDLPCSANKTIYKTYDELYIKMQQMIINNNYDVIIHSAAVSDYTVFGVYNNLSDEKKHINDEKISSELSDIYIHLKPTRKIIDDIRNLWNFKGKLIKFKLQVNMSDNKLIKIAKESRIHSKADVIVANCLEWCNERAYIITDTTIDHIDRKSLPMVLSTLI